MPSNSINTMSTAYMKCIIDNNICLLAISWFNIKELTQRSGLLELLKNGDSVMADCGFDIQDYLTLLGVKVNIPPFLKGKQQLDSHELVEIRRIAFLQIHVERAMERIKNYHLFRTILTSVSEHLHVLF